jgi:GAF domain-containing protein
MTSLPPDVEIDLREENARLMRELRAARDRQTATSDILRVISQSPTDVQPVFDAIVLSAARLLRCDMAFFLRSHGATFSQTALVGSEGSRPVLDLTPVPIDPDANFPSRAIVSKKNLHLPDWSAIDLPEHERHIRETYGINSALFLPLLRAGECVGLLALAGKRPNIFGESEIALAESFRDQALIAIENTRLFNETNEALERQTATADILKVIASSPSDVQPVFDVIVERAVRLCGARMGRVYRYDGSLIHLVGGHGLSVPGRDTAQQPFPRPAADDTIVGRVMLSRRPNILADLNEDETIPALSRQMIEALGARSQVTMPMLLAGEPIGAITLSWAEPRGYNDQTIMLLQTFADQAVIAIENVRLFNETREALERQTATAGILQIIASSPSDVQPVFDAVAECAMSLLDCWSVLVTRFDGEHVHFGAARGALPDTEQFVRQQYPVRPNRETSLLGRSLLERTVVSSPDVQAEADPQLRAYARKRGFHGELVVPLLRDDKVEGALVLTRAEPGLFAPREIELVQTFADQAVIAIQNARLFNETKEALERQTATADILKVIASSPSDVQPVFEAIATSAKGLIGGFSATVTRFVGDTLQLVAFTPTNARADEALQASFPIPLAEFPPFELVRDGETVQFTDTEAEGVPVTNRAMARLRGYRSMVFTPLMSNGIAIGMISVTRKEPGSFTAHFVQLLQTFADQAVIAIENVRLFNETREALERQTATADILKVIASSPSDVQPVFEAIAERSNRLVEGFSTAVYSLVDDTLYLKAFTRNNPEGDAALQASFPRPLSELSFGEHIRDGEIVQIPDMEATVEMSMPALQDMARLRGFRGVLFVPLLRDRATIGLISVTRKEPGAFAAHHIQLLQTFADQAVIAIENVRLFDEVQARTDDLRESLEFQTASSDVLKVISSSPDSLQPVLDVVVETSRELCGTETSTIFLLNDNKFHIAAASGAMPTYLEFLKNNPIALDQAGSSTARAAREKRTVHIPDIGADPEFGQGPMGVGQRRALLSVPLMREGTAIGVITMRQSHLTPFTDRQIEVVQTFADQAVIAISNVRLFEQVQARTRELSQSLDDLRTAQDRLIQTEKLASLGQLTAGIAHEIKNPLNFVNNFAALSAELTDELNDTLKPVPLAGTTREEVDELTRMLKDNLEKVVQHGKRADSIVKNMLLHSREGTGEHRPADINALLDESLNLAYHGARAEKPQFNVTLRRDFDENAGTIEVFPQEITRVFLNLISNGFYAVTKRKMEVGNSGFEPTLSATTRNLDHAVEIRIRDNGTGIPTAVKEKMFNPFYTTKPAGEGTGLGLSMSHDIVVKQHGGTIEVDTELGRYTEFRIVLPRASHQSSQKRGQT